MILKGCGFRSRSHLTCNLIQATFYRPINHFLKDDAKRYIYCLKSEFLGNFCREVMPEKVHGKYKNISEILELNIVINVITVQIMCNFIIEEKKDTKFFARPLQSLFTP